ncbi:TonB-dependent receptor family protein [Polaribacter porphyrae]|uniref:TonB-dependent receptor n=1 Tax=Polaribacter porphyrae TaxID=1137780 RepID=A0A2S7WKX8_9FLAO|nr:TonB-dependent receptor [Polaribacter porphyrae]PQJ78260.1 TonB-dependent receptor [Polaribacter porphyrae]
MKFQTQITILFLLLNSSIYSQFTVSGIVVDNDKKPLNKVQLYSENGRFLTETLITGKFTFTTKKERITIIVYSESYRIKNIKLNKTNYQNVTITLEGFEEELSEIQIKSRKQRVFELKRLKDVEGTSIYAGKKTEVVLVNQSTANLATNNARQIYNQVAGLNIFENDDAGLQLNIGGRGLDPNRTSNFNTRQNLYDISADVLGYPESYYTPAAEGLQEIQIVRGAASLQYGTQFGGLINFVMKQPNANKELEIITRNTAGSFGLYTNFTSLSGTKNKLSYYAYFNYKTGDGFRPNSQFDSKNAFLHLGYDFDAKNKLILEVTYLNYLAQQAGGLTDEMFSQNPFQSNRTRNWFKVNWLLYNLKYNYKITKDATFSFNFFGLNASRKAVGFRVVRVATNDDFGARDLIIGDFNNFGFEARFVNNYKFLGIKATYLIGSKYYRASNASFQGPGTDGSDANFTKASSQFPNYRFQSDFENPNENIAVFGENIFYINDKFSITPGFRFEYINTGSNGTRKRTNFDGAGNPIGTVIDDDDITKERSFALFGIGFSYKNNKSLEFYANVSQNYRSITFSDVNIINPSNAVDVNLEDEKGFTADFGTRGNINKNISYDANLFALFYNNRIGDVFTTIPPVNNVGLLRTNVGKARILGIESLIDFNLKGILEMNNNYVLNVFFNTSFINSEYTESIQNGIVGKKVEFVPDVNFKTGIRFGYDNFLISAQYSYLSEQFNDASNSTTSDASNAVRGPIPAYDILDLSASYKYKFLKLEGGVNNLLNTIYFTRRASGYPGPGIIPSAPKNYYLTLEVKI